MLHKVSFLTLIPSGGFLVIYRNDDLDFSLNNIGGDTVRLYDGEIENVANLIDSYTYTVNAPEGKSFARIPDGSNNWVDPIPTPGLPNSLEGLENIIWKIVKMIRNKISTKFRLFPS